MITRRTTASRSTTWRGAGGAGRRRVRRRPNAGVAARGARGGLRASGLSLVHAPVYFGAILSAHGRLRPLERGPVDEAYSGCATRSRCEPRRARCGSTAPGRPPPTARASTSSTGDRGDDRLGPARDGSGPRPRARGGRARRAELARGRPLVALRVLRTAARLVRERTEAIASAMTEEQGSRSRRRARNRGRGDHLDWNATRRGASTAA